MSPIDRRLFLRTAGVAIALPTLDAMTPRVRGREHESRPRRAVMICTSLGLHGPSLFPSETDGKLSDTPYLKLIRDHVDSYTLFNGLSHPDQAGSNGHSSEMTWLTAAPHPGLSGFRNSISVDQYAREQLGQVTRFPSLELSTHGNSSQSYSSSGVMVSAESRPSALFERMFLQGNAQEVELQRNGLRDGKSILDGLVDQTKRLSDRVGRADRERLDAYWDSLRKAEQELQTAGEWMEKPKPIVDQKIPVDVQAENDLIGRIQQWMDLIPLIIQTDSTRIITLLIHGRNDVPPVDGVTIDHHNLSHHGQDEAKIAQLQRIEQAIIKCYSGLLSGLRNRDELGQSLLKSTAVLFGSNLGNANSHDWHNLPILLAGGDFRHGRHVAFDSQNNQPLCNLFLTLLQRHLQIETDRFASSTGILEW